MDIAYGRQLVILAGAGPLLMLTWDAWKGQLGANDVNNALHITGILSLVFLFASLTISPLRVWTGWNSLVAYRRALGLYGFMYAALHAAIYVIFDRMGSLTSTIEEIVARRFLLIGFIAVVLMLPLAITSTNGMIRRLGSKNWKRLHRLTYVVAILGVVHFYMLVKSDVRQPLAFAAVLTPLLGFRGIKHYIDLTRSAARANATTVSKPVLPKYWTGELVVANIRQETPSVKTFRLVTLDGVDIPFRFQPGQYMTITLSIGGHLVKRSYTIASAPSQRGYVELTIRRHPSGLASQFMHDQIQVGSRIRIGAPGGRFYFDELSAPAVVLISGGVGITPQMSILRKLTDHAWKGTIYFIQAVRSPDEMIFADELRTLVNRFSNLRVLTCYSQASPGNPVHERWSEKQGYLEAADVRAFVPDLQSLTVFLCGPELMMTAVKAMLMDCGLPEVQIQTEKFVSPSAAATVDASASPSSPEPHLATIRFEGSGAQATIDSATTILEAAESAGVALPFECRAGICGQCKVRCVHGRVRMDSHDALSLAESAAGFILACQAHPVDDEVVIAP